MKAALKCRFTLVPDSLPDATKQELLNETEPRYCWVKLTQPIQQEGHDYSYLVVPFKLSAEMKMEQKGAGVLCQTEAEAKETFDNLKERSKKHLVTIQAAGFGTVGWVMSPRRIENEIGVMHKNLPDGKQLWLAFERETDQDTLEVKVIRRKETDTEGDADYLARQWLAEYNQKKKEYFDSVGKSVTPPPPRRCAALTKQEIADIGNAKMNALQKQWPRCFRIFEKQKSNPSCKIADQEIEDAYLLDLVEHGGDLWTGTGGKVRADKELISALHKAIERYAKRGKSKIIDTAIYLIAFNWDLGWCYLSDEQLGEKLGTILETPFTPGQVKQYRYRTLGLVAKHLSGPPPKSP